MRISVISIVPEVLEASLQEGVVGRALARDQVSLDLINPRDFVTDNYKTIDDRPFGGGPGMVLMAEPLAKALTATKCVHSDAKCRTVLLSPGGEQLSQKYVRELSELDGLILICGRYEGVDQRFIDAHVETEISIGDFVVSGGEIPALVVIDSVVRLLPGTLNNSESLAMESFSESLLDCPQYTRPQSVDGQQVPDVLLCGDHQKVDRWRRNEALARTYNTRPDLLLGHDWDDEDINWFEQYIHDSKKWRNN